MIQARSAEVFELRQILETVGDFPIKGILEIDEILRKLSVEESVLTVQELLAICDQISLVSRVRTFLQRSETVPVPHLQEKISRFSSHRSLEDEISRAMSREGGICDDASASLLEIRHRLRLLHEKVNRVLENLLQRRDLQPIFQDQFITLRNGRSVLPVKSDHQHRLSGIVHDQSQTRMTLFIEPLEVVPLNNEINMLVGEEKEEEYRILSELSKKARAEIRSFEQDYEILGDLDLLYAMATFSTRLKSVQPLLNEQGRVDLREARHPLLFLQKGEGCVPITLRIGGEIKGIIMSGANAGGKTVALKTLGLLTAMAQSGLPIPAAEGSEVAVFQDIFCLIGDEQDIERSLSTFSSHLLHLNQILERANSSSLILLDELGVGTHASEGSALAMGFLDELRARGATIGVSTHFDGLKVYGYLYPDVENVAVEFDEVTLEPKYTLSYGLSGMSNAFMIAEKLAVSPRVLRKARMYHDGEEQEVARTLAVLEKLKVETEKERQHLLTLKEDVSRERENVREILQRIKGKREQIFMQAEEKARKAVRKLDEELREWVRRQKEERKGQRRIIGTSSPGKEIQRIKETFFPSRKAPERRPGELRVGDRVSVEPLRYTGTVSKVEEPLRRVEVVTEKGRVKASFGDVVKVKEEEESPSGCVSGMEDRSTDEVQRVPSQVNLIGLTIEDALPILDKFLDQALLKGVERIQVIHGFGTGRLRAAIAKYLSEHANVKQFGPGNPAEGGAGVTVVELV